jgi:lipopolysaccharide/colanic/teichoic acid biosynthesis glycosyltransferase
MNNSELSVMTSSEDALTASQPYVSPASQNEGLDKVAQHSTLLRDDCWDTRSVGVERPKTTANQSGRGAQPMESPPILRSAQPDLGFWLLYRFSDRQEEWKRLREGSRTDPKVNQFRLQDSSSIIKRAIDVSGSLLFLVMLLPLFLVIAIAIKLDSPGPVFFRHYRVGKGGKNFVLWKFRSMRTDVPKYETSPRSVVDVRLTRIGRLIRRLSLDEMPQLINVLRGEMSLVGPRPEMPFIVAQYHPVECERLSAKPGITGLWQISPARAFPIHENLQYDLHYIRNQNLLLDFAIIVRTITAVIRGVGAV